MAKKKPKPQSTAGPSETSNEDNLPVMSADDCEAFDPSATKIAKSGTEEEEWEDTDDTDDIVD